MKKDQKNKKEQQDEFTDKQRNAILQKEFICKHPFGTKKAKITDIIDDVIDVLKEDDNIKDCIKKNKFYNKIKDCIRKYWFTKQIEEWKNNKNTKKDPEDDDLMEIVKEDLKRRIANTMLELRKHNDIKQGDIWFYNDNNYVSLRHNDDDICKVTVFNYFHKHISPPYKPFFMKNSNDENKLNGVCICKHGNEDKEYKTKWIMACFKNDETEPKCKITFKTNKDNKITNVEIETEKDRNSGKSTYTISLNESGKVDKITKKGEVDANKNYADEIRRLLFKDETHKHLTENIECELDNQQKAVFDNIKAHLGVVEEEKKEEENKEEDKKDEEKKEDNMEIINDNNLVNEKEENKNASSCNCCDLDLSCLKYCGLCK